MAFDKDKPAASTTLRESNPEIRANWSQLQTAINNEHIFSGTSDSTQTGDHTQGSARCFSQSSAPATRIDGNAFLSTDLGSLWVDTDDNALYILTATTPTWTPVSTEVIATLLAANRVFAGTLGVDGDFEVGTGSEFTVAAATGNVSTDGTMDVTGVLTTTAAAVLGDGSTLAAATETGDGDRTIVDLAYAKTGDTVQHDTEGGYSNCDVVDNDAGPTTTKTKVYTKYIIGTLSAGGGPISIAHGITGIDNIYHCSVHVFNSTSSSYTTYEQFNSGASTISLTVVFNGTNVILSGIGTQLDGGEKYRIRLDYVL